MITIKREYLIQVIQDLIPLLEDHYNEIAMYKDKVKLNPDYNRYLEMEESGTTHTVIVRDGENIIGYCISFLIHHPHYMDHIYAVNDIVFLMPEYRNKDIGQKLFTYVEEDLKKINVSVVFIHMKTKQPFEGLMQSLGYDRVEINYSKYIGN